MRRSYYYKSRAKKRRKVTGEKTETRQAAWGEELAADIFSVAVGTVLVGGILMYARRVKNQLYAQQIELEMRKLQLEETKVLKLREQAQSDALYKNLKDLQLSLNSGNTSHE